MNEFDHELIDIDMDYMSKIYCKICDKNYNNTNYNTCFTECLHFFHIACINKLNTKICPTCNKPIIVLTVFIIS